MYNVDKRRKIQNIRTLQVTAVLCNFIKISAVTMWKKIEFTIFFEMEAFLAIGFKEIRH